MTAHLTLPAVRQALAAGRSAASLVLESWTRAQAVAREGIFTALVPRSAVMARLEQVEAQKARGVPLPLYGATFSVKDNIHVAGMVTTCNSPAIALEPETSARVVQRLEAAGAILIGKNTLDQFATGLNGTRSPEPLCRNAVNPDYIPGGSSSGSAVAVARNLVSFSLGSDTGGSGRVPGACNGIVGLKPTLGLVSMAGLVYNSRFFDVVPIFARTVAEAVEVLGILKGYDEEDDYARLDADSISLAPVPISRPHLAIPRAADRTFLGDAEAERAFARDLDVLRGMGAEITEIDYSLFRDAGQHVFQTAMVTERLDAYADVMRRTPDAVHPAVRKAIEPGFSYSGLDAFRALYQVQAQRRAAHRLLAPFDAFVVPTVPTIFTIAEMLADPMARNAAMGTYTYFANPLDLCAISVPGTGRGDGLPSAICINAIAGKDAVVTSLAQAFETACATATA
ncbi:MAG: amidase family protein [Hyphomicrobiaceae bacterium]|nr:amidase family protein [Hyphomicrobiaceae bacterium]